MTGDGWASAVRRQLGLGRVLPLGGAGDGAWLTEAAATAVLRRAAERVTGARLTSVRVDLADADAAYVSAAGVPPDACVATVPAPPSALPPGPLRISGEFAAGTAEPLPALASRLRAALATAAADRLGLAVATVDLRVTALLDEHEEHAEHAEHAGPDDRDGADKPNEPDTRDGPPGPAEAAATAPAAAAEAPDSPEDRIARAALAVSGVTRLTGAFGGLGRAVQVREHEPLNSLPRRHVQVELAVTADRRALDVARAVRTAVGAALPDRPSVAVLVTAVDEPGQDGTRPG
ncbi:nucleopolyhedrovirus P10 family protein [Streptomyces spectabilis]|uniref:Nucleopolyhedrovirus P10 family protein n=1 Tax=Streptomyces spectabilis TaxID=68270 RepID=A0A516R573_STRST|nr:nucleopolyhedrovirus P10 family protein [Streptomyces spectabilis]QDQ10809.1 nucleopolyhedrovirus P10 family protein [Streptomyces spectabilis]